MKILLADSSRENKERLKDMLTGINPLFNNDLHVIKDVQDGQKALDEAMSGEYDLLICDLRLPILSGVHIIQELKKSGEHCKVIIYGTLTDLENLTLGLAEGALGYMLKPFRRADIERLLKKASIYYENAKKNELEHFHGNATAAQETETDRRNLFIEWIISDGERLTETALEFLSQRVPAFAICIFDINEFKSIYQGKQIKEKIENLIENRYSLSYFDSQDRYICLLSGIKERYEYLQDCEKIRNEIKRLTGQPVNCGVGDFFGHPSGISASKKGAEYSLKHLKKSGNDGIIPIWFIENRETPNIYWCKNIEEELISAALSGNRETANILVDNMKNYGKLGNIGYKLLPKIFLSLMLNISRQGEEHGLGFENIFINTFSTKVLSSFDNLEDSFEYLRTGILAICDATNVQMEARRKTMAEAILKYIQEFATQGVTVESMGERFNLLPTHIEKLCEEYFKESGKNLVLQEKMKVAKRLVLERNFDDNTIALMLGLDHRKFQETFYKTYGISTYDMKQKDIY